jgi:hypothetical protein
MSDFWKCPHCQHTQEKTDQLKLMAQAKRANAVVFANIRSREFPCQACRQTVDIGDLADGKFDDDREDMKRFFEDEVRRSLAEEHSKSNPILAFFAGGIIGFFAGNILVGLANWLFGLGIEPAYKAGFVCAAIGAVSCLIVTLTARK